MAALARHEAALLFVCVTSVYLLTRYPAVGGRYQWGAAAKWQYLGSILGVSHPPGSPLYVLLTFLWSKLPLGTGLGAKIMAFSSVCGGGAVSLLYASARRLSFSRAASLLAAGVFAFSLPVWVFSTEAEVYSAFALSMAFVIHRALLWRTGLRDRDLWAAYFVYALSFSIHYMAITYFLPLAMLLVGTNWRAILRPTNVLMALAAIMAGLLPMLWLWFRIPGADYNEFPGPRTWPKFIDFLLARQYRNTMFSFTLKQMCFDRIGWGVSRLGRFMGFPLLAVVPIGVPCLARVARRVAAFAVVGFLAPFLFWVGYARGDELAGAIPVLMIAGILVASVFDSLASTVTPRWVRISVSLVAIASAAISPIATAAEFAQHDPAVHFTYAVDSIPKYRWDVACIVQQAEPNATIVPPYGDYGSRQIVYYHRYADPVVKAKHLTFRYFFAAPSEWAWAPPSWTPDPSEPGPIYFYSGSYVDRFRRSGFRVEETTMGACDGKGGTLPFYRASH